MSYRETCMLPPTGWYCTRKAGHDGPCAAYKYSAESDVLDAARAVVSAYEDRFGSVSGAYLGPIDEEVRALASALKGLP